MFHQCHSICSIQVANLKSELLLSLAAIFAPSYLAVSQDAQGTTRLESTIKARLAISILEPSRAVIVGPFRFDLARWDSVAADMARKQEKADMTFTTTRIIKASTCS